MYDYLRGGRQISRGRRGLILTNTPEGAPLAATNSKGPDEYSDYDLDRRQAVLVVVNAR